MSDHFNVNIDVSLQKQSVSGKFISYRKYKSIDKGAVLPDLLVSSLVLDLLDPVDHLVDIYNSTLGATGDEHAPLNIKKIPRRLLLP